MKTVKFSREKKADDREPNNITLTEAKAGESKWWILAIEELFT